MKTRQTLAVRLADLGDIFDDVHGDGREFGIQPVQIRLLDAGGRLALDIRDSVPGAAVRGLPLGIRHHFGPEVSLVPLLLGHDFTVEQALVAAVDGFEAVLQVEDLGLRLAGLFGTLGRIPLERRDPVFEDL